MNCYEKDEMVNAYAAGQFDSDKQVRITEAVKMIESVKGNIGNVLDVGCGVGNMLRLLRGAGIKANYDGCDDSEKMIFKARMLQRRETANFDLGSLPTLAYKDGSRDMVMCLATMTYTPEPLKGIAELFRISRRYVLLDMIFAPGEKCETRYHPLYGEPQAVELQAKADAMRVIEECGGGELSGITVTYKTGMSGFKDLELQGIMGIQGFQVLWEKA